MIAIMCPSRGLIFSHTVECIINGMSELNRLGFKTQFFTTHDLPIPEAQNSCVERALSNPEVDRIISIEEDNYFDAQAFVALATSPNHISILQYPDKNGSPHSIIHYNQLGEIIWSGIGAASIKREVFEKIGSPYFRTNVFYKLTKKHLDGGKIISDYEVVDPHTQWDEKEMKFVEKKEYYKYGGLDIDFYHRARKLGYKIHKLEGHKALHFELVKLGQPQINNGCHQIRTL